MEEVILLIYFEFNFEFNFLFYFESTGTTATDRVVHNIHNNIRSKREMLERLKAQRARERANMTPEQRKQLGLLVACP